MKKHIFTIFAEYLYAHPFTICEDDKGFLMYYDARTSKFMYHNPKNKTRKGWYEARGMTSWYNRFYLV